MAEDQYRRLSCGSCFVSFPAPTHRGRPPKWHAAALRGANASGSTAPSLPRSGCANAERSSTRRQTGDRTRPASGVEGRRRERTSKRSNAPSVGAFSFLRANRRLAVARGAASRAGWRRCAWNRLRPARARTAAKNSDRSNVTGCSASGSASKQIGPRETRSKPGSARTSQSTA